MLLSSNHLPESRMHRTDRFLGLLGALLAFLYGSLSDRKATAAEELFRARIAPLLEERCLVCHDASKRKGGLSLESPETAFESERGPVIVAGDPDASRLLAMISSQDGKKPRMPKSGDPLAPDEVRLLREWIAAGAPWPNGLRLAAPSSNEWWSLERLEKPRLPELSADEATRARTPIDTFIIARQRGHGLAISPEADRRTLIRRLWFDVLGLPPSPEEVERFVADDHPLAWERLVDRVLASPGYGERWARHWLDIVHYADTHGYDKDKPRPNAWPYRDWVIRSLNEDKPYSRFVREQIAGDVFWPETRDGIAALGFIAAGPWDFIGHAEVPETKIDGMVARNLDRDDMVTNTANTFLSLTIQCARCHEHKFDPVTQEDYYSFQAVFAALDRADRPYEPSPQVAARRRELETERNELRKERDTLDRSLRERAGPELAEIDRRLELIASEDASKRNPRYGYHSAIESSADRAKWVQVDLGSPVEIERIVLAGCDDDFAGIGAGFGFPRRFRIDAANDASFERGAQTIHDETGADFPNPGVEPVAFDAPAIRARFVRVTATKLALRQNDWIFALSELRVLAPDGTNLALGAPVTALDSIEAPVRWASVNLVDDIYPGATRDPARDGEPAKLEARRRALLADAARPGEAERLDRLAEGIRATEREIAELPAPGMVYSGTVYTGGGAFRGTGPDGGKPREIHVLRRGDVQSPGELVGPGVPALIPGVASRFDVPPGEPEGERRRALADWIVHSENPLTWRSIVNRVWQYHFGRGIVDTPNDFGRMGGKPSHPDLLDWLAVEFRDGGQSLAKLHRLILTSAVYRQSSTGNPAFAAIDSDNRFLWRMNRRRLEAEAIHDAVLSVSGRLDRSMYGPGFQCFVIEKPEHSPHYEYHKHDPDDPATHRRAVYRFIVRSQPDPYFRTLDCADSSQSVPKRDETLTALQALALLNDNFMMCMARHFAERVGRAEGDLEERLTAAWRLSFGRDPDPGELREIADYARDFGLENACRVIFNLNEFVFVD